MQEQNFSIDSHRESEEQYLLEQFNHPEKIELNGEQIEVVDISPRELKTQEPTLILPGFSATPEALKDAILRTAEAGRRVISAKAPHGISVWEKKSDLPYAERTKLELVLRLIEEKGLETVNVIANSESSIYSTTAALLSQKVSNMVLVEPVGLIGKDSLLQLLKRTREDMQEQARQDSSKEKVKYPSPNDIGVKSVLSNIVASVNEVRAIADSDITGALEELHKSGVGISIIHGVDDKMFPMERVQKMVKEEMIDGFYSVQGTHNSIYVYEPYGRVAEEALSALENKKKNQADKIPTEKSP